MTVFDARDLHVAGGKIVDVVVFLWAKKYGIPEDLGGEVCDALLQ